MPATPAITNDRADGPGESASGDPAFARRLEGFPQALTALRNSGVRFKVEPREFPSCHLAVVRDPDGDPVALHPHKSPA